jgi:hypothetical protein
MIMSKDLLWVGRSNLLQGRFGEAPDANWQRAVRD